MKAPQTITVAIDGSRSAWDALHWAADEALHTERRLVVVHAGDNASVPDTVDNRPFGRALLDEAVATLADSYPTLQVVTTLISAGSSTAAASELVALSAATDLIVLGRARRGVPPLLLGSVGQRVMMRAACPTVVVPSRPGPTANRIVVGVSNTPGGRAALDFGFAEAFRRGAQLTAVRSWSPNEWQLSDQLRRANSVNQEKRDAGMLNVMVSPFRERYPTVHIETVLTADPVDVALRRAGEGCVLLVLGRRRAVDAALGRLGPVAMWAITHFDLPVMVVGGAGTRTHATADNRLRAHARQ